MLARRLLVVCVILLSLFAYLYFAEGKQQYAIPAGIVLVIGIFLWIFQHQINWSWYKRNPPGLPGAVDALFRAHRPFYASLEEEERKEFGRRVSLFVLNKDWIIMGPEEVPEDLKYMVAYYAGLLTWRKGDFLFKGYDRVVFYLHPFLTPHYKEQVHTYEVEHVDGTIILAIDHLTTSFLEPGKYYQTGLHCLAEVFQATVPGEYPDGSIWPQLEMVQPVTKKQIEEVTGLNQEDPWPTAAHHWFSYAGRFEERQPELYGQIRQLLGR